MQESKKMMAMSKKPSGGILITQANLTAVQAKADPSIFAACLDAVITEIVPQTEAAFADFVARHGGKPIYPTLAAYPKARG